MEFGLVLLGIIGVLVVWAIVMYNSLVAMRIRAEEAWADIDVQLKRRYDLIPNLVETVKGYASHERETLESVMEARASATQVHVDPSNITPDQITAMAGAEAGLGGALGRLMAVAEAYPDLKANQNFSELQASLEDTENKIQAARRFYNSNVRDYNTKIETVPSNIIANMFAFVKKAFFELPEDSVEKEPVKVQF